uniref:TOG domain-containing protein n=1 Tax=Strigamia maritima TaxID=126957 RepID=T1IXA2_STRMM
MTAKQREEKRYDFADQTVPSRSRTPVRQICMYGLEILGYIMDRSKDDFRPYLSSVLPATIDRLGDNKDQVRDQGQLLIQKIMHLVSSPQVRDASINALVEIYRHVGDRVRLDVQRKYNIPQTRLVTIMAKFDEVRDSGQLLSVTNSPIVSHKMTNLDAATGDDEVDKSLVSGTPKRASSAPPVRRAAFSSAKPPSNTGPAGAVDEETFIRSFEDVPKIPIYSAKDMEDSLTKCREILLDPSADWEKRCEAMKKVRGVVVSGGAEYDEFVPQLRMLESAFQTSVKDLRSQIVRETCVTIAYFSQELRQKVDHFAEVLLPNLISLIPNSAKVMSTAGTVAIRFIIRYTFASRLIPIITAHMTNKSKDIRKACGEFMDQLLHTWPTHTLERHIAIIQEAIKKGISDADKDARTSSRKAFWGFASHFSEQADSLLNSLDSSKQKMLYEQNNSLSNSSSNNSLNNIAKVPRSRASSAGGSTENLTRASSFKRTGIPMLSSPRTELGKTPYFNGSRMANGSLTPTPLRSNSAIDLNAVQRARARNTAAAASRFKVGSGASLPRPPIRKMSTGSAHVDHYSASAVTSPERVARSRTKLGASQSQPSSRSGSPSSRLSYATYNNSQADTSYCLPQRVRRRAGVVHSTGTSRETSPSRNLLGHERRLSGSGVHKRTRTLTGSERGSRGGQVLAQRILTQTKEAEVAVADALVNRLESPKNPLRRRYDPFGNESDDSETSSVCSERSYGSYGRAVDDVAEVINNLASQHWADRKEGLVGLQAVVNSHRTLSACELKRVTDIFTKMFMDPHTKVFSIFLDTLRDLIITHKLDLNDWLYVLITRLFNKQGVDLLGSVQTKLQRTLDLIRDSFSFDHQFAVIMKFLVDQTQTPNVKVKLAVLNYLQVLCEVMSPSDFTITPESQTSISKIITWTTDPKSAELRKASQAAVVALFNSNTPEFTKLLNQLSKLCQDNASKLLHNHLKRTTSDDSPLKITPMMSARSLSSPNKTRTPRSTHFEDTENMNPDEVWTNLRRTTTEIQNYSFDTLDHGYTKERTKDRFERDRDTTSQDSGISQMSAPDGRMDILEESPENGSPTRRKDYNPPVYQDRVNRNGFDTEVDLVSVAKQERLTMTTILAELANYNKRIEERKLALAHLSIFAKEDSAAVWDEHFKAVLRILLETLTKEKDGSVRALSLRILCDMLRKQTSRFQGFAELTVLKILEAHKDAEKDVVRAAETCATTLAGGLAAEQCVRVLIPIILTGEYPVIEQQPQSVIRQYIDDIMPGLIKAYDNQESSVRKAAVFCMVAAHTAVGEALKPYLDELNGSKLKLLTLYIKRAQPTQSTSPTSPQLSSQISSQETSPRT